MVNSEYKALVKEIRDLKRQLERMRVQEKPDVNAAQREYLIFDGEITFMDGDVITVGV